MAKGSGETANPQKQFASYESVLDNYVRPELGGHRLCDLKPYDVQKLYNGLIGRGLSARTVRYAHVVLSSAFKQAERWNLIAKNPCGLCDLPRSEREEMRCFTPDEATAFLGAARADKFYVVFLLALETGMRPEEYLGLQWKDVDFDTQAVSVRRSLVRNRKGGGFEFTEPKTKKSRRSIPISPRTLAELREHRKRQLEAAFRLGAAYGNLDLVFATEIGLPLDANNLRNRHFKKIVKDLNTKIEEQNGEDSGKRPLLPEIRLYDLRHTTASLLLSAGENPKVVQERLGHASIVLTLDTYSHVLPTMQKDATAKLEKLMFRA